MRRAFLFLPLAIAAAELPAGVLSVRPGSAWATLQEAVDAASSGDTLRVEGGLWPGTVRIDKPMTLLGAARPVLDGRGEGVVLVTADDVTLSGFAIRGVATSYLDDRAGIRVRKASRFALLDNHLQNTFFGIYLEHAGDGLVRGNRIEGQAEVEHASGNAIHAWYCSGLTIEDNEVRGHRDGIYLEFVDDSRITGNLSEDNLRYGLHFMFSNDDMYRGNVFRRNGAGVAVMFSRRITMRDNDFHRNWGKASYGLLLKEISDAGIEGNRFVQNTVGILVEGSNRVAYRGNQFDRNGWAIRISGGCLDTEITGNDFLENTFDLALHGPARSQHLEGNHWRDYAGYDLDRDGYGDIPHRPVKLFNHVVDRTPESIVLLRSLFVDLLNFAERVSPVFTPETLEDKRPRMRPNLSRKP